MDQGSFFSESLLFHLGGGVLAGVAVGYAVKRTSKLLLFLGGLLIIILYALLKADIIAVHWDVLSHSLESGSKTMSNWLLTMVKDLSASMVGFGGGVLLGLKLR